MSATDIAQATMRAWESKDANSLASSLSDDFVGRGFLPQPVNKVQYIDFMQAIVSAFPDWSFNENFLNERPIMERGQLVLFDTHISGTNTGDLILPDLPIIPATGIKIALPNRHLEYLVTGDIVATITADFSPNGLEEILAQFGMVLP